MRFESAKIEEGEPDNPTIVLDEDRYAKGFPEGEPGETREGFSFFAKYEREDEEGNKEVGWEYITSDMVDNPTLVAVTEDQKEKWSKREMRAIPSKFIWDEEGGMWQVVPESEYIV